MVRDAALSISSLMSCCLTTTVNVSAADSSVQVFDPRPAGVFALFGLITGNGILSTFAIISGVTAFHFVSRLIIGYIITSVAAAAVNLLFVIIQRYNRPRVLRLLKRKLQK